MSVNNLASITERMRERAERSACAHAERMAALPPGTCEDCYGERVVEKPHGQGQLPCAKCNPPLVFATGVPVELREARFDNYRLTDASHAAGIEAAHAFMRGSRDLFLVGGVGTGKTRLAATIANECANHRTSAMFCRVLSVLNRLMPGRMPDGAAAAYEDSLFTMPVLVLDDLGAEQSTDYARRKVMLITEERHDRGFKTIWTSNKSLQELAEMHDDDRLASRLAGRSDIVRLTGPDQRVVGAPVRSDRP